MRKLVWLAALVALAIFAYPSSSAWAGNSKVEAKIDLSKQRMYVYVNGKRAYTWKVSTGKPGYATPKGRFSPKRMKRVHYSDRYNNAYMPHSIFFIGGYAIHGTTATGKLGRPVSHGCVRLSQGNAKRLYNLVAANKSSSRIVVVR
jgi:lipoprotein-anchoring transpeptidase ErfK/SrfK